MSHMKKALEQLQKDASKDDHIDPDNQVALDSDSMKPHPAISTGSVMLNHLIGGTRTASGDRECPGLPVGKIVEIFGKEGSGKTTACLHACKEVQKTGGSAAFLDYEHAIVPRYAEQIGVDFSQDKFALYQPVTWEEGVKYIEIFAKAGVDLIIVDSLAAMVPQKEYEAEISDERGGGVGLLARKQAKFLRRIVSTLKKNDVTLVYTNQERQRIKMNPWDSGPDYSTPGGTAMKYYASLRIRLRKLKAFYDEDAVNELTGEKQRRPEKVRIKAVIAKTKISSHQGDAGTFYIRYGKGIDNVSTLIKIAEHKGIIRQAGAWFTVVDADGEEHKYHGRDALVEGITSNSDLRRYVIQKVKGEMDAIIEKADSDSEDDE